MTAHDFADQCDVRRAIAGKDVGDLSEVDGEEAGVNEGPARRRY